jgi:hypothetical protein
MTIPALRVLALPPSLANERGLLVPITRAARERAGLAFPLRISCGAWLALIEAPVRHADGSDRSPTPPELGDRLDRLLQAVHLALNSPARQQLVTDRLLTFFAPAVPGSAHARAIPVAIVLTYDLDAPDLTLFLTDECLELLQ